MIVIDTHVLIWLIEGDTHLGRGAAGIIEAERAENNAGIAPMTAWEMAMLVDKHRLGLGRPIGEWFDRVLATPGFVLLPMTAATAIDAGTLPGPIHGDPCDRIIIATARAFGCPLLTADRKILDYAATGHVRVIDANR